MKDFGIVLFVLFILVLAFCIGPFLLIWSVNTLAELGGSSFHIPHTLLSYLAAFVVIIVMKSEVNIKK